MEFSKPRKDFPTAVSNFKRGKSTFPEGVSPGGFKKLGSLIPKEVDDLKDKECFKCHKVHHANKCPESKAKK